MQSPPISGVRGARRGRQSVAVLALAALAVLAVDCGGSAASTTTTRPTTTSTAGGPAAAYAWLRDKAEPWNHMLNADQRAIDTAAGATSESSDSRFFSHLEAACSKMLADVTKAREIRPAPATALEGAWSGMLAKTATYASDCLTLTRSHAAQDLTAWNNSLTSMNQAAGAWNTAVNTTRAQAPPSSG